MRSQLSFVMAAATATALGGCFILPDAKSPKTNAVATGEPLAVVDDVKVWTTTSKEKVGESVVKDSHGNTVGTVENYQDRTQTHSMKVWYGFQGAQQLADEDFFRIAGDQTALSKTEEHRLNAIKWNRRGKYLMVGGAIALIAGVAVAYAAPTTPVVAPVLEIGGGLALAGGWSAAFWGARQMQAEVHAVDRSLAERDAIQYNQQLGRTGGLSMGRKF
jgi:hypothetical protein